jgi:serine/threonine protein phosphatase PrpC
VHESLVAARPTFERFRDSPSDATRRDALAAIVTAFEKTCTRIHEMGREGQKRGRMGTTLDVLVRAGDRMLLGHVGDGRVCLFRGGKAYRLTEDHTIVAEQIKTGFLTEENAAGSQFVGVLTRAIGTHRSVKVDTLVLDLNAGDRLLMCSDGLHRYATLDELPRLLGPETARVDVTKLIEHANASGGADNISAILLACRAPKLDRTAPLHPNTGVVSRIDAICRLPLFQHLSYREQVAVLALAQSRSYEAGSTIVHQGKEGHEMFIVVNGQLVVERDGVKIAELGPGGHFGEMSLVDDAPRSATVKAQSRTDVLTIGQAEIHGLMRADPVLGVKVLWTFVQVLSARLRMTSAGLTELQLDGGSAPTSIRPFAGG